MSKKDLIGRLRGRRNAKVLVDSEWNPSSDFDILVDKIYKHIVRTDQSSLNGVPRVDVRKYLNWWKLRTCGRNVEFGNLHLKLNTKEEDASVCLLFDLAGIKYDIEEHGEHTIAFIQPANFRSLLLWNVKLDPYESLKCFNETTQSSDFREYDDKKISFQNIPRSHLPEIPDIRAQAILEQWKKDLSDAVRRQRRRQSSSRTQRPEAERATRSTPEVSRHRTANDTPRPRPSPSSQSTLSQPPSSSSSPPTAVSGTYQRITPRRDARKVPTTTSSVSTVKSAPVVPKPARNPSTSEEPIESYSVSEPSSSRHSIASSTRSDEPEVEEVIGQAARNPDSDGNMDWRGAAWTVGSRVLYEILAAVGREHAVRTEERQLNMRLAAATAEQNQQFWSSVASWGAWSAHTAVQYYFGAGRAAGNLLGNGS